MMPGIIGLDQVNSLAIALAVAIGLLVAWWLWGRRRGPRVRARGADALDAGAAPAARNQALIDAPSAAAQTLQTAAGAAASTAAGFATGGPDVFGGIGEVLAAGAGQAAAGVADLDAGAGGDDLTRIKGVGPKLSKLLGELGVTRFAEIAGWSDAELAAMDARLGAFAGRPARDGWVEQCRFLSAGDIAGFEARFGRV